MASNQVTDGQLVQAADFWAAFEQFPPLFRQWLTQTVHSYDAGQLLDLWKQGTPLHYIRQAVEAQDRLVTAETYGPTHPQA